MVKDNTKHKAAISTWGVLKISGDNAKKFLQGQLTCNMDVLSPQGQLAAHCNPQGRVISLFYIFEIENDYYLCMPKNLIEIAHNALKKYAVFFKVHLEEVSDSIHPLLLNHTIHIPHSEQQVRIPFMLASEQDIKEAFIKYRIPTIYAETSAKFLPHELNLPALGAVDFDKGCYTGQEIIARMHYRGKVKTQLFEAFVETPNDCTLGADIYHIENGKALPCGNIVNLAQIGENQYQLLIVADSKKAITEALSATAEHPFTFLKVTPQNREAQ